MIAAGEGRPGEGLHHLLFKPVGQMRLAAKMREVDQPFAERRVDIVMGGEPLDLHVGRLRLDSGGNLRNELGERRHGDPEDPVARCRVEQTPRRDDSAYAPQH